MTLLYISTIAYNSENTKTWLFAPAQGTSVPQTTLCLPAMPDCSQVFGTFKDSNNNLGDVPLSEKNDDNKYGALRSFARIETNQFNYKKYFQK